MAKNKCRARKKRRTRALLTKRALFGKKTRQVQVASDHQRVFGCYSLQCRRWNSGTAAIPPQTKQAKAYLVTSGHRRHPASGLSWGWGRSFVANSGPFFSGHTGRPENRRTQFYFPSDHIPTTQADVPATSHCHSQRIALPK